MSSKAMSLKGRINHYAKQNGLAAQVVLQNFMFERFLERLSRSEYRQKFVIKGGMLVTAIVGIDTRTTMDLDTTLRNLPLTEPQIREAITAICNIPVDDDVSFQIVSIEPIRKDDIYGGYRVRLDATYDTVLTPLSIDVSTGDVITPNPAAYELHGMFNPELKIPLWGYNIETILAEKVETILMRERSWKLIRFITMKSLAFRRLPQLLRIFFLVKGTASLTGIMSMSAMVRCRCLLVSIWLLEKRFRLSGKLTRAQILLSS